jgi:hypothetical protein
MKKFAPLMIAASAALSTVVGCAVESGNVADRVDEQSEALNQQCVNANNDGTNAAIAALAAGMASNMHRWQLTTDFSKVIGYNNQTQLAVNQNGLNACGGSCDVVANLLLFQDSRMDQKIVFYGTKLNSWTFASRLVTGYDNQLSCQRNYTCPFVGHVFDWNIPVVTSQGVCDTLFTYQVTKPAAQNHAALTAAEISGLANALVWTQPTGVNPFIQFQTGSGTVSVDPTGDMNPPGQTTGADVCQQFSMTNINGTPCTCAANNVTNGQLKNDIVTTPKTYYCRQL